MKKGSITRFRLNPKKPPKTNWHVFDAMSEEARHQAVVSDPNCPPATEAQLARARRVPSVRALRKKLKLTQEEFAARFHLPLGTVRDWEQGAHLHPPWRATARFCTTSLPGARNCRITPPTVARGTCCRSPWQSAGASWC